MIVIKTADKIYGPFSEVEVLEDRYRVANVEFPFDVIGPATIEDYVAPPPTPAVKLIPSVTPRQIRQALNRAGLRATVEAAVAASNQDIKDWYEFSTMFHRNNPEVINMGAALGITPTAMDDLWLLAATL